MCKDREDDHGLDCLTFEKFYPSPVTTLLQELLPRINLIYSHNFMDFNAFTEPVTKSVSIYPLESELVASSEVRFELPCVVHQVQLNDNLIDPLSSADDTFNFISAES